MRLLLTIYSYNIATLKFQRPTSILKKADWGKLTINDSNIYTTYAQKDLELSVLIFRQEISIERKRLAET